MELLEHIFDHDDREIQKEAEDGIEVNSNSDYKTNDENTSHIQT